MNPHNWNIPTGPDDMDFTVDKLECIASGVQPSSVVHPTELEHDVWMGVVEPDGSELSPIRF